ncbi:cytidine deaminase [Maribacter confluentis]|uniref:Cytidine deaminase n=1 Tax=Maribacter confluentis TaxID=1656093 RepID=A0ABT8RMG0_9FLAO|nr:cytidine deaminase [Maribacter confluentis]MDO1512110.1 cytidine deaminase [Maribacter confluentis]
MAERKKINIEVTVHENVEELNESFKTLMSSAINARKKAYAPYSKFSVGAAVLMENNEIIEGNNQENACYPAGLCAERVAIFYAGAKYPEMRIRAMAISAAALDHGVNEPVAPCGSCRQAISEYEFKQSEPIKLLFMGETGKVIMCNSVADLLPLGFNSSYL